MAYPSGAIPVTGGIGTTASTDTFPTNYDYLMFGGLAVTGALTDLYAIPTQRRVFGMLRNVTSDGTSANNRTYMLANILLGGVDNDITNNSNWILYGSSAMLSPSGGVTSVNNATSDTSLTISPNTGAVKLAVNLANAFTWTGQHTFNAYAPIIGTATASSLAGFDASKNLVTLSAATARGYLGGTTIGQNIFTSTNPSAIAFLRANADNSVSWLSASAFITAIGGLGNALTSAYIFVGNASNVATGVAMSQDSSITNTGAVTNTGLRGVALPSLGASAGLLKYTGTGTNTWVFDTNTYLTGVVADAPLSGAGTSASHLVIATANTSTTGALSSTDWNTFNNKLGTALTSAYVFVGNGSNVATGVAISGDSTISNAGAMTNTGLRGVALPSLGVSAGYLKYTGTGTNTWVFDTSTFVTSVSVTTNQGVSGSSSGGATPALTISLGALTGVTSFNGLVVTANTGVITTGTWQGSVIGYSYGGTNANSAQGAMNNLAGAVTSGYYLRGNGTNVVMAAIQAGDVPTLNQNTTGQAGKVANAVTFNNGGSGAASGTTFDGSAAQTISYNTIGAAPASASGNYIQNTTSQQASSNFNISGAGVIGTTLTVNGGAFNLSHPSTASANNIVYVTGGVNKWFLGTSVSASSDNFEIYNGNTSKTSIKINTSDDGVTLAGALSGTSASFSGTLGVGTTTVQNPFSATIAAQIGSTSTVSSLLTLAGSSYGAIYFATGTTGYQPYSGYIQYTSSANSMLFATNGTVALTLASTGAATFASNVVATQINAGNYSITNSGFFGQYNTDNNSEVLFQSGASTNTRSGIAVRDSWNGSNNTASYVDLFVGTGSGRLNAVTINYTGAATFASNTYVGGATGLYASSNRGVLEVNGTSTSILALTTGGVKRGYLYSDGGSNMYISTEGSANIAMQAQGYVDIATNGTTSAIHISTSQAVSMSSTLSVQGTTASTSYTTGALVVSGGAGFAGAVYSNTGFFNTSDPRLKDFKSMPFSDSFAIKAKAYTMKVGHGDSSILRFGYDAKEVYNILPSTVSFSADKFAYRSLNMTDILVYKLQALENYVLELEQKLLNK